MSQNAHWQPERYRPLLRLRLRQVQLDPRLRRRFDDSDLVQEALLRAHQKLAEFRGDSEAALVLWLEQILASVLVDAVRRERAWKRDVALERSLDGALADSSGRLAEYLSANGSSPHERAERHETLLRLAAALERLPDDQHEVIVRRDLTGAPVAAIAAAMGRTEKSVAGLLLRARRRLRELLCEPV
jgi:RNA polymerase sigma-70 factor (ECF subfamily)